MAQSAPIPPACPECGAKVRAAGAIRDQDKARLIKFSAGIVAIAGTIALLYVGGAVGLFDERFRLKYVVIAFVISMIPAGIVMGVGAAIPKIKEVRCSKCRWKDEYLIASKEQIG